MLRRDDPVGGQQGERATAVALAQHQAQRGRVEGDEVRQRAGDLAGQAAVLGVGGEGGALGVDDRHERQPELGRQPHPAPGLAQRLGSHRVVGGLAAAVLAEEDARRLAEARERDQQPRVALALPGPVEGYDVAGGVAQQPSYARPVRAPRPGHAVPRVDVRHVLLPRVGDRGDALPGGHEDAERAVEDLLDLLGRQDGVDDAAGVEVLRGLHALGEGPVVERLVDPGAEEADERARLGDGDVAERAPRRHHAAGGGVAQVDEVGQARGAVRGHGGRDPDHLHEGRGALLHAGAAAHGCGHERQALAGRPLDAGDDPVGRGPPDRPGQEAELAHQHGDPPSVHPRLAGQHRLVDARLLGRGGQLGGVRLADAVPRRSGVPGGPRALVEDQVDQVVGGESSHAGRVCLAGPRRDFVPAQPAEGTPGAGVRPPDDPAVEERRELAPGLGSQWS